MKLNVLEHTSISPIETNNTCALTISPNPDPDPDPERDRLELSLVCNTVVTPVPTELYPELHACVVMLLQELDDNGSISGCI